MREKSKEHKGNGITGAIKCGACLCAFLLCLSVPALAKDKKIRALNQKNVRAFIQETSHLTKGQDEQLSSDKIVAYLEKHLADQSRFVSTVTYRIPEMPPQEIALSLDKAQFIEAVGSGSESIQGYETHVEITEVKLSWGRKKAHIKTKNTETGFMAVPSENGGAGEMVPIEGRSTCAQSVVLNSGVIQMSNAVCKTEIKFLEY